VLQSKAIFDFLVTFCALSVAQPKLWYATTDKIAKIVITTSSSTRVNALFFILFICIN
jgi:hypothetical protein